MLMAPQYCCLIVALTIGCFLVIFSYILLSIQDYDETEEAEPINEFGIDLGLSYRSFYDFSLVFTHSLISGTCCYYLWTNHESAAVSELEHTEYTSSFMINFRKDSWSKAKAIYLYEMDLEWNEFNIAAIIFFIHQMLTFILLLMNVIHSYSSSADLLTALSFLVEALSIVLLSICLNAEHNPHFYMNREVERVERGKNVMQSELVIFLTLTAIICLFFEFLTYPSVNNESFTQFIQDTYNCSSDCSLQAHFVVNELIFRVFVGVTLLNLIFFLLSVLFGEHPHYPSFGGAKSLIRPCWFTAFLVFEIMEIALIQDQIYLDMLIYNAFWCCVNSATIILCVYHAIHHLKPHRSRNQWDRLNIATKYEGMLLLVLRTVSLIFVYLDGHSNNQDWTVYRQIVITIAMYFHMATLWLLKKPSFNRDSVQFLLKFITYINAYNLVFSLIFETSHFLELLTVETEEINHAKSAHGNQSYFLVSFSTSFAIAHSNLWFLSQYWEWTQKKRSNRNKMSAPIPLKTPKHKEINIIADEYNTFL